MPYRIAEGVKCREDNPFKGPGLQVRDIVVIGGAVWPTGMGSNYVIPLGIPMSPVTATTTGKYKPIRRTTAAGAATAAETAITVSNADGFAVGDIVNIIQANPTLLLVTVSSVATITALSYSTKVMEFAALGLIVSAGCFIEVAENGAATNVNDCVYLGQNVQTRASDDSTSIDCPAIGYVAGQVQVSKLATNCYDKLTPRQIPGFDYIPTMPGLKD